MLAEAIRSAFAALPSDMYGSAVFTRVTKGVFDPLTDTRTGDFTETMTVAGVVVSDAGSKSLDEFGADGLVLDRARMLTFTEPAAGLAFAPSAGMTVVAAGRTYAVKGTRPTMPDGTTVVLWEALVEIV